MNSFLEKHKWLLVAALLVVLVAVEYTTSLQENQTIDEGVHLAAGYSYLMKRDFRMNTEHPPLIKELAAFPLVLLGHHITQPFASPAWNGFDEWRFAHDFLYDNVMPADTILLLGRLPLMLLSLLLGYYVFRWANELFGIRVAFVSLVLYCFSPNIIAHSRYITTDVGVTTFYFITAYYLYRYIKTNSLRYVVLTGVFFGLAEASKFNAVMLAPVIIIILIIAKIFDKKSSSPRNYKIVPALLIIFSICALIIFGSYLGTFQKAIDDHNVQKLYSQLDYILTTHDYSGVKPIANNLITFADTSTTSGKYLLSMTEYLVFPAYPYLNGIIKLFFHNYTGHLSYLLGQYSDFGWWYYFPVAYATKTPLTELFLIGCGLGLIAYYLIRRSTRNLYKEPWFYCVILPPFLYFAWSMTGHINLGVRHVLIIEPFALLVIGYVVKILIEKSKLFINLCILILVAFQIYSVVKIYPNYLAYFNEAAGGPSNGHSILVDSNLDWGQDLKKLKKYLDDNSIDHVCMSYFGQAPLDYYGIDNRYLPDNQNIGNANNFSCVVAISITSLYSRDREYGWLLNYTPTTVIGYSIPVYDFRKNPVTF